MNWKPHTENPDRAPQSSLISCADDDGGYYLLPDLHTWDGSKFRSEETDKTPRSKVFWWVPESEALEGLPT